MFPSFRVYLRTSAEVLSYINVDALAVRFHDSRGLVALLE